MIFDKFKDIHCLSDVYKLSDKCKWKGNPLKYNSFPQRMYNITNECEYNGHPYYINITNEASNIRYKTTVSYEGKRLKPLSNILYYTKKRMSNYWYRDDDY